MDRILQSSRWTAWWEVLALPTWRWVVLIPIALFGTAQLVRDEFLSPETAEKYKVPKLLADVSWHWWIVILLVSILIILMESSYRAIRRRESSIAVLDERLVPKISAIYDPSKPPCRSVATISDGRSSQEGMVYRIEVENIGEEKITNCEGYLTEVAFEDEPTELGTSNLTWSTDALPPYPIKIDLIKGVKRHLDVLVVYQNNQIRVISRSWPLNRPDFFSRLGNYRFVVVVSGDGSVALPPYKLRLNFTGDWQTSTMEPVA